MAHQNLGSSRVTPSRLGGFTSKSNKCHKDCFIKLNCSSADKEDLTQPLAWTYHKSHKPHFRGEGKRSQSLKEEYFHWWNQQPLKEGKRGKLLYYPSKTSRWKLASKNWNIRFLKYSRYRPNRALQFGNRNIRLFEGLVRDGVYKAIVFHSSHLKF
jgi:hypothetical protein